MEKQWTIYINRRVTLISHTQVRECVRRGRGVKSLVIKIDERAAYSKELTLPLQQPNMHCCQKLTLLCEEVDVSFLLTVAVQTMKENEAVINRLVVISKGI